MSRKHIFTYVIGIIVGFLVFCAVDTAIHYNSTLDVNVQCFQLKVDEGAKPKAVVYEPSNGIAEVWKGVCETDVLPKASKEKWTNLHPLETLVAGLLAVAALFVGLMVILFYLIIGVLVSLYRWAFNPLYDDQSIISVYIDFVKHP
jgi:hypothetical protein